MFGDPDVNPMGWPKVTFEEISEIITDGEHATPKRVDNGIYLLSARNVLNHELSLTEVDYIDQEEYSRISKRIIPKAGDVLISCSGTVGRVCTVPKDLKFQMVRSIALVRFVKEINPVFMEYQISMPYVQNQIDASKSQTSQANLFQGKIKKLTVIVPPTELQNSFLQFVEQADKSKFDGANRNLSRCLVGWIQTKKDGKRNRLKHMPMFLLDILFPAKATLKKGYELSADTT